jgi:sestrin
MYRQGALSYEYRHYIALMAASRHKCYYLVNQQENEFLSIKGNKKWLENQENLPAKIRELFEINKLLW